MARNALLLQVGLLASIIYAQNCYYPNGTANNFYVACDADAINSACCAPGDECLTNGLCRPAGSTGEQNDYWRDLCTDQSWESDACAKYCYNESTSSTAAYGTYFVTACTWNTYCCADTGVWNNGADPYACCSEPVGVFTAGPGKWLSGPKVVTATYSRPAASSSTSKSSASTTTTQSSTMTQSTASLTDSPSVTPDQSQTSSSSSSSGLSTGDKAAIGICIGVVALVVIAVTVWSLLRRSRQNHLGTQAQGAYGQEQPGVKVTYAQYAHYAPRSDHGQQQQFYDPPVSS